MEIRDRSVFLSYLDSIHARSRRVMLCIPAEHLEWAPAPGMFTLGDTVRHLATIERYMYAETVSGRQSRYAGQDRSLAEGLEATLAYYDRLHDEARAIFASLSDDRLKGKCLTPAGTEITTWKWLRAMIEHEVHHRGQIYLILRMLNVPTPPLYGLTSEEVRAKSVALDATA
jgi:uncharacterized damage-inducible protein DinB